MALNWVMLDDTKPHKFIPLPSETILFTSPERTSFQLSSNISSSSSSTPKPDPYILKASSGVAYVTSQRILYLPTARTPDFESFSAPLLTTHDAHVTTPLFGPNLWVSTITPVANGNLPTHRSIYDYDLKFTFKDGGAFDFHNLYERMKEKLHNAVELGEDVQETQARGLDDLPSYEDSGVARPHPGSDTGPDMSNVAFEIHPPVGPPPVDGPPPYEEAQLVGVMQGLARRG